MSSNAAAAERPQFSASSLLRSKYAIAATVIILLQGIVYYSARGEDRTPLPKPLAAFPTAAGNWNMLSEGIVEKETLDVLRADDTLTRMYSNGSGEVNLFMAYFATQRTGQSPHSPKNCLPGSGWQPTSTGVIDVTIPVSGVTIHINRYVVAKGDSKSVVLYWYQSHNRVIADEFAAKFYLISDSIRMHRSDTALVRIVAPVIAGDETRAVQSAVAFVKAAFPSITKALPSA